LTRNATKQLDCDEVILQYKVLINAVKAKESIKGNSRSVEHPFDHRAEETGSRFWEHLPSFTAAADQNNVSNVTQYFYQCRLASLI
jgi:hypothetical protein